MPGYVAPLEDMEFVLTQVADLAGVSKLDGFQHADPDSVRDILAEAARFFTEVVAPTNRVGDVQGARLLEDGTVETPEGFREAYARFVEAGWASAHIPEEWGGGGLPYMVGIVLQEMFKSANMALSLCPMLTQAAIGALIRHGTEQQRAVYLERLVRGEWTGTMCLTEPQAGSDLGAVSTRAVPAEDGSYRITGQKLFITWGEHDLTENIVHLVLARTPDSPPGTRGISMFLVPKHLVGPDGSLGPRNDVRVVSLEHKLGIHASPTCTLAFGDSGDGAVGFLVGEEQAGMRNMFTMMNTARIGVGIEGLALGERSYQQAVQHAFERRQGRAVGADPSEVSRIVEHPDVRRMLLTMRAWNEAIRCLLYTTAEQVDHEHRAETEDRRRRAGERVALLTPVAKAWPTDIGVETTSLGLQVHGGMGYVEETGVAQHFRDARIAPIYEGTNGIQAIDLVVRKLPLRNGRVVADLLEDMRRTTREARESAGLEEAAAALDQAVDAVERSSRWLLDRLAEGAQQDALAGASPYLRMLGATLGGWMMARSAVAAGRMLEGGTRNERFLRAKGTTARFYCTQLLPPAAALHTAVTAGADRLFEIEPERLW